MTTPYSTTTISLATVTPTGVPNDGGYALEITGVFRNEVATVTLDDGNGHTFPCYSGKAGDGYSPRPRSSTVLRAAMPVVPSGLYDIVVSQTGHTATLALAVFVYPPNKRSKTRAFKRVLAGTYAVGPEDTPLETHTQLTVAAIAAQSNSVGAAVSLTPTVSTNPSSLRAKWSIGAGSLPAGLSVNAATGAITGTLTAEAVSTFTLRATTIKGDVDTSITWTVLNVDQFLVIAGFGGDNASLVFDGVTLAKDTGVGVSTWIAKLLSSSGVTQWASKWIEKGGAPASVGISGMSVDSAGNVYVVGATNSSSGAVVKIYDVSSNSVPVFTRTQGASLSSETYLTKYNKNGVHQWTRVFTSDLSHAIYIGGYCDLVVMSNDDVLFGLSVERDSICKLQVFDGTTTTDIATNIGAGTTSRGAIGFVLRYDGTGALVTLKKSDVLDGYENSFSARNYPIALQKKNTDHGIVVAHSLCGQDTASGRPATTMTWDAISKTFDPGIANSFKEATVHYDATLTPDWTADAFASDPAQKDFAQAIDVDTSGNVYSIGEAQSFAAGTLSVRSADWTTPTSTVPSRSSATWGTVHYEKRSAAGALQWLKGLGASSSFPGSSAEILQDVATKGANPYLVGRLDGGASSVKLDEGLGTVQTIVGDSAPFSKIFLAKLNPADGSVAALKKVNGNDAAPLVSSVRMATLRQSLLGLVGAWATHSLTFGPGEGGATTLAPSGASNVAGFVALFDSETLALALAKRFPTSGTNTDNFSIDAVCGAKA